uniref:Uncharacterized protein n=1 Tax=Anopheles albimanus TaxID=7167 RepID=A0A182FXL5_ANOAL
MIPRTWSHLRLVKCMNECKNPSLNVWHELKTKKVRVTDGFLKQADTSNYTFP